MGCITTTHGAIAGTTCADVIFSVGIGRAIRHTRARLKSEGLATTFQTVDIDARFGHNGTGRFTTGEADVVDTSFVDDVGSATGATALQAVTTATRMATIATKLT